MNKKGLKAYHFFISWLLTLFTGFLIACIGGIGIGLITTVLAGLSSLPFILLFLLLQHNYLKKSPTKSQLHARTFLLHFIGALLVFAGYVVFGQIVRDNDSLGLIGVMAGYFVIDSIFFHAYIQTLYVDSNRSVESEVLDMLD